MRISTSQIYLALDYRTLAEIESAWLAEQAEEKIASAP